MMAVTTRYRRAYEVHPLFAEQALGLLALVPVRVVHGYGVASELLDQFHTGDVSGSVSEVDHAGEGDRLTSFIQGMSVAPSPK